MNIYEEIIHILLDNQKKIYNELNKLKKIIINNNDINIDNIISYDNFSTSNLENGIVIKEINKIIKTKNNNTIYIVIKQIDNKIYKFIETLDENEIKYKEEIFLNCSKKEFENEWKLN